MKGIPVTRHFLRPAALLLSLLLFSAPEAAAGVGLDGTVGPALTVDLTGPAGDRYLIRGDYGTLTGRNLFHSFSAFDVEAGNIAIFTGAGLAGPVDHIIGRVTGGGASAVDGFIGSTIDAVSLWLLNPRGVIFGPGAALRNIHFADGSVSRIRSFHVSTADHLDLGGDGRFSAADPGGSVLTASPPAAFGFLGNDPAPIVSEGQLLVDHKDAAGKGGALSLVGGDVSISGGYLWAQNGTVRIASVASPGTVAVGPTALTPRGIDRFGRLAVSGGANVQTSDTAGSGPILIRAGRFDLGGGARVLGGNAGGGAGGRVEVRADTVRIRKGAVLGTYTVGRGSGGDVDVAAATSVHVSGPGGIFAQSEGGRGKSGDIAIRTGTLTVDDGGVVSSGSLAAGDAGEIAVKADRVAVTGEAAIGAAAAGSGKGGGVRIEAGGIAVSDDGRIWSANGANRGGGGVRLAADRLEIAGGGRVKTANTAGGAGGDIDVDVTDTVTVRGDGTVAGAGAIETETTGTGRAGDIRLAAGASVDVRGAARISNISRTEGGGGDTGDIAVEAPALSVRDDGWVGSESTGTGNVGDIAVAVDRLELAGGYLSSSAGPASGGGNAAGSIAIRARQWAAVRGSGRDDRGVYGAYYGVYAQTQGAADGGDISIETPFLLLSDDGMVNADTYGPGRGGAVDIAVDTLEIRDGGTVVAQTRGDGPAGSITVRAAESVFLGGEGVKLVDSWIYTATHAAGDGGDLTVTTPDLTLAAHGVINASTFAPEGGGAGGRILLEADRLTLRDGGAVTADSYGSGRGGGITVVADEVTVGGSRTTPYDPGRYAAGGVTDPRVDSSGIYARAGGTGSGGDIVVATGSLRLEDTGEISARSTGGGDAGAIAIRARTTIDLDHAAVTTEAAEADGGDIRLEAAERVYLLWSEVTATVGGGQGGGGNVFIDPVFVILNNSRVSANADEGPGGNIHIAADHFLADAYSSVEASSRLGIDGSVDIEAPDTDLSGGLVPLPESFLEVTGLLRDPCAVHLVEEASSLFVTGGGGLPLAPGDDRPAMRFGDPPAEDRGEAAPE